MLNLVELAEELKELTAWQETPVVLDLYDYVNMVKRALRKFFVDINSPAEYDMTLFSYNTNDEDVYERVFGADEIEYILTLCKIEFFQRVQSDVNNAFGYSTNALTVTNADKPYANLKDTLAELKNERRINYYKMTRYSFGDA